MPADEVTCPTPAGLGVLGLRAAEFVLYVQNKPRCWGFRLVYRGGLALTVGTKTRHRPGGVSSVKETPG